ncbi:MAG: T9SS type A sorting domain-containing protein [Bacteroidetes bacterium]|nr:MAG: T9SS type A sorting domain-containing protein [Bacteroidota bacterium]
MNYRVWLLFCVLCVLPAAANFGSVALSNNYTSCRLVPVRLGIFTVSATGTDVLLKWTTEYEENVNKIVIEKSNGTGSFEPVGEVMALNNASSYSFSTRIDEPSFFRLRIVDIDGRSAYSKILSIRPGINPGDFSLLANPVTDGTARITTFASSETNGEFILHDITGRLMKKFTAHLSKGTNFIKLSVNELIPGTYTLQYHDSKMEMHAIKLIKLN